jgi:C4-dicarboxylate transporter
MKKFLSLLTGLFLVFVVAGSANATPITFDIAEAPASSVGISNVSIWGWTNINVLLN